MTGSERDDPSDTPVEESPASRAGRLTLLLAPLLLLVLLLVLDWWIQSR